jgi:hypothetical protein
LGFILCVFFTNSSGHPVPSELRLDRTEQQAVAAFILIFNDDQVRHGSKDLNSSAGVVFSTYVKQCFFFFLFPIKNFARGGERTRVLMTLLLPLYFIYFLIFTTLPLSHSSSPLKQFFYKIKIKLKESRQGSIAFLIYFFIM